MMMAVGGFCAVFIFYRRSRAVIVVPMTVHMMITMSMSCLGVRMTATVAPVCPARPGSCTDRLTNMQPTIIIKH